MAASSRNANRLLFWFAFSLLFAHEMDAMVRHEWRLLPGFSSIASDTTARDLFTLVHIPVFAVLPWLCLNRRVGHRVQQGVDVFLVLHALAHFALSGHAHYEFTPPVETITVFGAGVVGALDLMLLRRWRPKTKDSENEPFP